MYVFNASNYKDSGFIIFSIFTSVMSAIGDYPVDSMKRSTPMDQTSVF